VVTQKIGNPEKKKGGRRGQRKVDERKRGSPTLFPLFSYTFLEGLLVEKRKGIYQGEVIMEFGC